MGPFDRLRPPPRHVPPALRAWLADASGVTALSIVFVLFCASALAVALAADPWGTLLLTLRKESTLGTAEHFGVVPLTDPLHETGYSYRYSFTTRDGSRFEGRSYSWKKLFVTIDPLDPPAVTVEYCPWFPSINRIQGTHTRHVMPGTLWLLLPAAGAFAWLAIALLRYRRRLRLFEEGILAEGFLLSVHAGGEAVAIEEYRRRVLAARSVTLKGLWLMLTKSPYLVLVFLFLFLVQGHSLKDLLVKLPLLWVLSLAYILMGFLLTALYVAGTVIASRLVRPYPWMRKLRGAQNSRVRSRYLRATFAFLTAAGEAIQAMGWISLRSRQVPGRRVWVLHDPSRPRRAALLGQLHFRLRVTPEGDWRPPPLRRVMLRLWLVRLAPFLGPALGVALGLLVGGTEC